MIGNAPHILWSKFSRHTKSFFIYSHCEKGSSYQFNEFKQEDHSRYPVPFVGEEALKKVRKVKQIPENNKRLRFLSSEECQALIEACDSHLRPIVITALNTGMRKGEILDLRWDQVDLKHGFILLEVTKNGERREISINETLRQTLEALTRHIKSSYVFWSGEKGKPYQGVKRSFDSAVRRAGIKDFRFHDGRHCFASHLVMLGVDLTSVKELLGHKTLTMTLRYGHLAPSHKVKAVGVLDR